MLRIYARVWAAVLGVIAIAAAVVPISTSAGLGASVLCERALYGLGSHLRLRGLFAQQLCDHSKCSSSDGLVLVGFGAVGSADYGHRGVSLRREGLGSWASARCLWRLDDGMRSVVAL